jgi:hypothetical protein
MRTETAATILEYFGGSSWAKPDSKRHAEAAKVLEGFSHEDIVTACKSLRASLARTHCKAEELVGEIRRNKRREVVQAQAWREGINPDDIERERKQARNAVLLAPREVIAAAVAKCRKIGALDATPLSPKVEEWSAYTVGMVYAAIEEAHG